MPRRQRFDWFQFHNDKSRGAAARRAASRKPLAGGNHRRLRVESLEERRLLSITVDTLVDEADGSIVDGDISLRDAIAAAPSGETIDFSVTGTITLTLGELFVEDKLTIDGPGAASLALDGAGLTGIFVIDNMSASFADVEIRDVTLQNGNAGLLNGGAIVSSENLTLRNVVMRDNVAARGGAISTRPLSGSNLLLIENSLLTGNVAENIPGFPGGGAIDSNQTILTIQGSTIVDNVSQIGHGGGHFSSE